MKTLVSASLLLLLYFTIESSYFWSFTECVFDPEPVFFLHQYLGSMLVKELRGTESTQDACAKMRVRLNINVLYFEPSPKWTF